MNRSSSSLKPILVVVLASLICARPGIAEDAKATAAIEPKAIEVMQQMADYFAGLKGLSANASVTLTMEARGQKREKSSTYTIAMQRPNQFAMTIKERSPSMTLVSDGAKLYLFIPSMSQYTVTNAPPIVDGVFSEEMQGMQGGLAYAFMNVLAAGKPRDVFLKDVRKGRHAGIEDLNGVKAHHLTFTQDEFDWEIWVQDGAQPWPLKVTQDFSKALPGNQGGGDGSQSMKMVASLLYSDWAANPTFPETTFRFTPPEGAKAVATFMPQSGEARPHALLGKTAPTFKLGLLDGGQVDLYSHKGKDVVILDFWATWCGPCRLTLPMLSEVATEYKDKGVVFYAVNIQEDPETIRDFMKKQGYKFSVPLDKEGSVAESYGVEGIPQTVIVGKDGVVQVVNVGAEPNLKKSLKQNLDDLLAGKRPAAK